MEARPDVAGVEFEDRRTAYENYRGQEPNALLREEVRVGDLPESFRVRLTPDADHAAVARAASRLPGVSNVVDEVCVSGQLARPGSGWAEECDFSGDGG